MTRTQIQNSLKGLVKTIENVTQVKGINIELCSDGILVDHEGMKNEKVLDYFKSFNLAEYEYDAECNCSYYSYKK